MRLLLGSQAWLWCWTTTGASEREPHAVLAGRLAPVHEDPFDRMLVAQARTQDLTVVTGDPVFERYGVTVLEA